jgi:ABC-2 type transport system permease protein
MNIFIKELKSYRNGLFFWSLGMFVLVVSGMAKFAAYSASGPQSITDLMAQFPKSIQVIFGLEGFDLTKASGFYGVIFLYIALMATVHAVLIGTDIISKEERDKTSEFLFVKPISRAKVITGKLLAGLINIIILNIVTWVSSIYFVNYFGKGEIVGNNIQILMFGLFMLQLLFFVIGFAVASISKKSKTAPSVATAILLVTFILSFLVNLNPSLDKLKYLLPYKYFDAHTLMASGYLDPVYTIITLLLITLLLIFSYIYYPKRDLDV